MTRAKFIEAASGLPISGGQPKSRSASKLKYRKTPRFGTRMRGGSGEGPLVVGVVHASWCGACKAFIPEWTKMAGDIQKEMGATPVVTWEESADKAAIDAFASKYGGTLEVSGFPTIFKLKRGAATTETYAGARDKDSILLWMKA